MKGGREICRAVDLNRNGVVDTFVYFDEHGRERRREYGFERANRANEIDILENGQLVRKERETNNDGKLDTWDYYENGRLVREERDTAGDGMVHQWWTFPQPNNPSCGVVVSDLDGDGKPDQDTRVDMCAAKDVWGNIVDGGSPTAADAGARPANVLKPGADAGLGPDGGERPESKPASGTEGAPGAEENSP